MEALKPIRLLTQPLIIAVFGALLLRATLVQTYSVPSDSMWPTLQRGDHILVTPYRPPLDRARVDRGDVVVFRAPLHGAGFFVKRVIAVPGDTVEIHEQKVAVNGRVLDEPYLAVSYDNGIYGPLLLARDEYFVMGDHRDDSVDSRSWGILEQGRIVGRARMIFWSAGNGRTDTPALAAGSSTSRVSRTLPIHWRRVLSVIR